MGIKGVYGSVIIMSVELEKGLAPFKSALENTYRNYPCPCIGEIQQQT
jgi:hypothetical protein